MSEDPEIEKRLARIKEDFLADVCLGICVFLAIWILHLVFSG